MVEKILVNGHQIDRSNAMLIHGVVVGAAPAQNSTVNFGVQRFDPAIHHFRKPCVVRDFRRSNAVVAKQFKGAAGGEDFDALCNKGLGEFNDAGFVGYTDQCAFNGSAHAGYLRLL